MEILPYLFLLKTSTFSIVCGIGAAFTFAYLDLLQGAVLIIFAVVFAFGNGAADGMICGVVVKNGHGEVLLYI